MYKILSAKIDYNSTGQLERITVLVEISKNDIRAITATSQQRPGYTFLTISSTLNDDLLQDVAGYGMETEINLYFPDFKQ